MKDKLLRLIRFGVVGGSATALDACVYAVLLNVLPLNVSKLLSMLVSCTYSYILQKRWTFRDTGKEKSKVLLFALAQVANIAVNVKVNELAFEWLDNKAYAFVIATGAATIVNYCLQRWVVFQKTDEDKKNS